MVIIDTNIIIDHQRQKNLEQLSVFEKYLTDSPDRDLTISVLSLQELYTGRSTRKDSIEKDLLAIIGSLKILPYKYETAVLAGKISRDLKNPIGFPDSGIAATAIANEANLLTLNTKHFKDIPNLVLEKLPS